MALTTSSPNCVTPASAVAGRIFALGDSAAHGLDSRRFGTVPLSEIVGRVRQVWFSWGEGGRRSARLGKLIE